MSTQRVVELLLAMKRAFDADIERAQTRKDLMDSLAAQLETPTTTPWAFPVGTPEHPPKDWYAYTVHDLTGRRNPQNYGHTGLDLNGDWRNPETGEFRGNVDIGEPVFAVADAEVVSVGWSGKFRAGIVLKVDHFGLPLYVRYWHLRISTAQRYEVGDLVASGDQLGEIDEYPGGYAHLHFDVARQPFRHNWWFTRHKEIEWANPAYILKLHLDVARVDAMLTKSN